MPRRVVVGKDCGTSAVSIRRAAMGDGFRCVNCKFIGDPNADRERPVMLDDKRIAVAHLIAHRVSGHTIPDDAIRRVLNA